MMFLSSMKWCCIAIILSAVMGSSVLADVIYREVFPNDTGVNISSTTAGWYVNIGNDGAVLDWCVANGVTEGGDVVQPVNSFPAYSPDNGYLIGLGATDTNFFHWTTEYTVDRSQWDVTSIGWRQRHNVATDQTQVALQIANQWYVSSEAFTMSDGYSVVFDLSGSWSTLDFTSGTALGIGNQSSSSLPDGDITGLGFYCDYRTNSMRFDSVTINASAVPEPSVIALLAAGLLGLAGMVWRKKR